MQATPDTASIQASISLNANTADLAIQQLTSAVKRIFTIL